MSHRASGVTVLEVVLVVMLLAVVATIAAPRFGGGTVESSAAAERLASDLRRARLLALTQGRSLCVVVVNSASSAGYRVTAYDSQNSVCPTSQASAVFDPLAGSFDVTLGGVSSMSAPPTNFRFLSDGSPSAATSFILTTSSGSITVTVASVTGHVAVQS